MKKYYLFLVCLVSFALCTNLIACNNNVANSSFKDKTEDRKVAPFTKIELCISADVILEQGENQKVTIEAEKEETLKYLETEVSNSSLIIHFSKNFMRNTGKVTIKITVPTIEGLTITGSGDIKAGNKIKAENIDLEITGSGTIVLSELSAANIKSEITGSGNIKLAGKETVVNHNITISGSGNVIASDLETETMKIEITGSGDCKISAKQKVTAEISGSGSIFYNTEPAKTDINITGSGKFKKMK